MSVSEYQVYRRRWAVLGAYCLVMFTAQLLWIEFATITQTVAFAYGPFADQNLIAFLTIEGPLVSFVLSFPFGAAVDKWGWKNTSGFAAAAFAVIGILRAFSPDLTILLLSQIAITTVGLFVFDGISKLSTQWFPFKEGATAQGLGTLSLFLGLMVPLFLSPVLVNTLGNPLLDPYASLRDTSLIYGFFAVIAAVLFFAVAREKPPKPPEPRVEEEEIPLRAGFSRILRVKQFWVLSALFFVGFVVYLGLTTWIERIVSSNAPVFEKFLEVYFAQTNPYVLPFLISQSQIQGGTVGALITLGGIIGCLTIPVLSDKVNRRKPFILLIAVAAPPLIYIVGTMSGLIVMVAAFLLGFFLLSALPISFQVAMETKAIGPMLAGLAVGGLYTFGNLGGAIGPLVMESLETSSLSYLLSQLYYWQSYLTAVTKAWWFVLLPSAPLALPGSFLGAIFFLVIVSVALIAVVAFLEDTHAEAVTQT
ncbi:MAG: MFS transporter [Candidatus Freyrarchaeum guaymaensis]|nr:MFS transporter [Candidatus Sigynarchaeota archaeon]